MMIRIGERLINSKVASAFEPALSLLAKIIPISEPWRMAAIYTCGSRQCGVSDIAQGLPSYLKFFPFGELVIHLSLQALIFLS